MRAVEGERAVGDTDRDPANLNLRCERRGTRAVNGDRVRPVRALAFWRLD